MTTNTAAVEQRLHKYPRGVFSMFFLQLLGMVGFSMIFSLLVLYCTRRLGMSDSHAYALTAAYNALVFATSVFGGYLGERYLGYRFAVMLSIAMAVVGLVIMMVPKVIALYWGLAVFTISTGIMVPCMFVLLGRLYGKDDPRRDTGFTLAYMGMNVGSFFASITSGFIATEISYGAAFLIGAVFNVIMLLVFLKYRKDFKHREIDGQFTKTRTRKMKSRSRSTGIFLVALSLPLTAALLNFAELCNILMLLVGAFSVGLVLYFAMQEKGQYRRKLIAFLVLTTISVAFWSLYMLAPSALTVFIQRNVDRHVLGLLIPAASYSALNPFFIVSLGALLSLFWMWLNFKNKSVSVAAKFAIGTFLMGVGYLVLVVGIALHNGHGYVSSNWIVLSYLLQTFGELFVGPIGFAMVGELVPARMEGLMMGIWQLAAGVAGAMSEFMSNFTAKGHENAVNPLVTNPGYSHAFLYFGLATVAIALINFILIPLLKKMSRTVSAV